MGKAKKGFKTKNLRPTVKHGGGNAILNECIFETWCIKCAFLQDGSWFGAVCHRVKPDK